MRLIQYTPAYSQRVQKYYLTPEMQAFTGAPTEAIRLCLQDTAYHPILGLKDDELVSFFVLDEGPDKQHYTNNANAILLRSFSADARHTQKGYAKTVLALLPAFVQANFAPANQIVLAVNEKNTLAQRLYLTCGFTDTDIRRLGPKGQQMIFSLLL